MRVQGFSPDSSTSALSPDLKGRLFASPLDQIFKIKVKESGDSSTVERCTINAEVVKVTDVKQHLFSIGLQRAR